MRESISNRWPRPPRPALTIPGIVVGVFALTGIDLRLRGAPIDPLAALRST